MRYLLFLATVVVGIVGENALVFGGDQPGDTSILILRNGQLLKGHVAKNGDFYDVDFSDGHIQVRSADVETVCNTLEEGYQYKRSKIAPESLRQRFELVEWCQKQGLREHAAEELTLIAVMAPNHPMVGLLERRMKVAGEPAPSFAPSTPPPASIDGVSSEELDRMVQSLPPKSLDIFTKNIQPILLNNCTTSGCHGSQSDGDFRLSRLSSLQTNGRRLTQRNLYSVLQYIDRDHPTSSKLLTRPIEPHGTAKNPIFTERQLAQYQKLAEWVLYVSQTGTEEASPLPPTIPNPVEDAPAKPYNPMAPVVLQNTPRILTKDATQVKPLIPDPKAAAERKKEMAKNAVKQGGTAKTPSTIPPTTTSTASPASFEEPLPSPKSLTEKTAEKASVVPEKKTPVPHPATVSPPVKDAFDPEIFNRRHFDDSKKPEIKE